MASIFLVDDEPGIIDIYKEFLAFKNYKTIEEAFDGEEAVTKYRAMKKKPDVVILDHRMPLKNGLTAMKEILTEHPLQCVVFVTADENAAKNALSMGATSFMLKPFRMDNLFNSIRTALMVIDERKNALREKLLGIITRYKSSDPDTYKQMFNVIEKDIVNEFIKHSKSENVSFREAIKWACEFLELCGTTFELEFKSDTEASLCSYKCYWMEKVGADPIFCNAMRGLITRFMMKARDDVEVEINQTMMNGDICCLIKVS